MHPWNPHVFQNDSQVQLTDLDSLPEMARRRQAMNSVIHFILYLTPLPSKLVTTYNEITIYQILRFNTKLFCVSWQWFKPFIKCTVSPSLLTTITSADRCEKKQISCTRVQVLNKECIVYNLCVTKTSIQWSNRYGISL